MNLKYSLIWAGLLLGSPIALAQSSPTTIERLLEQASETSGLVIQYERDQQAVNHFYGAMSSNDRGASSSTGLQGYSPEQIMRLQELDQAYLSTLEGLPFEEFTKQGQVDYILLKNKIEKNRAALQRQQQLWEQLRAYFPFAEAIYAFEKERRRGNAVDGERIAKELHEAFQKAREAAKKLAQVQVLSEDEAQYMQAVCRDLTRRLNFAYDFYQGYDPLFSWWVPEPYKALSKELSDFAALVRSKQASIDFKDGSGIGGRPIGRDAFARLLREEMISYTPEELLKIADKEFAWCEAELLKAAAEMGYGKDWKAAQEQVKNTYVPPGKQPETIIKLNQDALDFIRAKDLIDLPDLANETWGMVMMSAEQQAVSPFFLGGRNILVAYPTQGMSHEQKLMSMRGNNPYFARGIVQHELVPGHHLQYFMNNRFKPYRSEHFNTPFWTEGWTLYWELLLYDLGFPKTPEERIGMLFWRMHRCARITFSIKYHLGEWTPQQCIDYLVNAVGHEPSTAHGEVKRSFEGNYGPLYQLAYMIGGLQVWNLKQEAVDRGGLSIKDFHERFMKENYMPIEMLRAIILDKPLQRDYQSNWKFYQF